MHVIFWSDSESFCCFGKWMRLKDFTWPCTSYSNTNSAPLEARRMENRLASVRVASRTGSHHPCWPWFDQDSCCKEASQLRISRYLWGPHPTILVALPQDAQALTWFKARPSLQTWSGALPVTQITLGPLGRRKIGVSQRAGPCTTIPLQLLFLQKKTT